MTDVEKEKYYNGVISGVESTLNIIYNTFSMEVILDNMLLPAFRKIQEANDMLRLNNEKKLDLSDYDLSDLEIISRDNVHYINQLKMKGIIPENIEDLEIKKD